MKEEPKMPTPEEMAKINKERVMYEKEVYETAVKAGANSEVGIFIRKILGSSDVLSSTDKIIYSDATHENELRNTPRAWEVKLEAASTLNYHSYSIKDRRKDRHNEDVSSEIEGIINGKKVKICSLYGIGYSGEIDGQEIDSRDAELIYNKYALIAEDRSHRIKSIGSDELKKKMQEQVKKVLE